MYNLNLEVYDCYYGRQDNQVLSTLNCYRENVTWNNLQVPQILAKNKIQCTYLLFK